MITSVLAAAVMFAILIIVHEAGHFMMAKRMGVRVLRFFDRLSAAFMGLPAWRDGLRGRGDTAWRLCPYAWRRGS